MLGYCDAQGKFCQTSLPLNTRLYNEIMKLISSGSSYIRDTVLLCLVNKFLKKYNARLLHQQDATSERLQQFFNRIYTFARQRLQMENETFKSLPNNNHESQSKNENQVISSFPANLSEGEASLAIEARNTYFSLQQEVIKGKITVCKVAQELLANNNNSALERLFLDERIKKCDNAIKQLYKALVLKVHTDKNQNHAFRFNSSHSAISKELQSYLNKSLFQAVLDCKKEWGSFIAEDKKDMFSKDSCQRNIEALEQQLNIIQQMQEKLAQTALQTNETLPLKRL